MAVVLLWKKTVTEETDSTTKQDGSNQNQRKASRHNQVSSSKRSIDPQDKTECDRTADKASAPDEEKFFESKRWVMALFVAA